MGNKDNNLKQSNSKRKIASVYFLAILSFILLVFLDQIVKYIVDSKMELYSSISVIKDVFEIRYIRNPGAAWGIFANQQLLFYIITMIVCIIGVWYYIRLSRKNLFRDIRMVTILILAGAVGNLIDRLRFQYVIDFFYFKLIDFPVFNIADCYVTVGFAILIILVLFKYKEEDFEQMK